MTLVPWRNGRHLVWDATCSDTLAASNVAAAIKETGSVAENAANRKRLKYKTIIEDNYIFVPFAVETMGPWCQEAIDFVEELGNLTATVTGEDKSRCYIMQRISLAIQKGNAACIMGTLPPFLSLHEIFYLL